MFILYSRMQLNRSRVPLCRISRKLNTEMKSKNLKAFRIVAFICGLLFFLVSLYSANTADYRVTHKVFLDIAIEDVPAGRIVIGLFGEEVPKTVRNFYYLSTGKMDISYRDSLFTLATPNFAVQGGRIKLAHEGMSTTLYGKHFEDENFNVKHTRGIVSMANNRARNTNGSEFFIVTKESAPWLDGRHVGFGKVLEGMDVVEKIEHLPTSMSYHLLQRVTVTNCGEVK